MGDFAFPEWLNANSVRAYPISEGQSRLDTLGLAKLPDSLVVAASITAHPDYVYNVFYISQVTLTPTVAHVELSTQDPTGNSSVVCVLSANVADGVNQPLVITGEGQNKGITGVLTLGDLVQASTELAGTYNFDAKSTGLEPTVIYLSVPMLNYVQVYNGDTYLGTFNDILSLQAGQNVQATYVDSSTIRLDVVDGLNAPATACTGAVPLAPPIRTINGIPGDAQNNFTLNGGECVTVTSTASGNGLTIADICSKSCCGCTELQDLVVALQALQNEFTTLQSQIQTVQSTSGQMIANLVANMPLPVTGP